MPEGALPLLMFLAGFSIVAWILMRRSLLRGTQRRKFDSRPIDTQPRPTSEWSGAYNDASAKLERQKVELAEFTRDANGQIDSKVLVLRELIRQSDEQIRRMEELLAEMVRHTGSR